MGKVLIYKGFGDNGYDKWFERMKIENLLDFVGVFEDWKG